MRKASLGTLFLTVFLDLLGFGLVIPFLPGVARDLGASDLMATLLASAFSLMQFLFVPVWGRLSDRVGRRPVLLFSIAATALGMLLLGWAGSLVLLFVARLWAGIGTANIAVAQAYIADVTTPENRARGMGLIRAAIDRVLVHVAKALGAYEHELRSRDAPFDRFVNAGPASGAISDEAKVGARLFVGRASCIDCHSTPLLSDGAFHDVGVAQSGSAVPTVADCWLGNPVCDCTTGTSCLPWGFYDGLAKLKASPYLRSGDFSDDPAKGASHAAYYDMALSDPLKGRWRTPSLRDVALTAPYMHTGGLRTLEDVVWHYDAGGGISDGHDKAKELRPLLLAPEERAALVEFLKTLTGRPDRPDLHVPPPGARL